MTAHRMLYLRAAGLLPLSFNLPPVPIPSPAAKPIVPAARRLGRRQRLRPVAAQSDFAQAVESLSAWQRNRWARAGYPGLRDKDPKPVGKFARLVHG